MGRQASDYSKILDRLKDLHRKYPSFNMGRHFSTIISDYGDPWGISDRELLFAVDKYITSLEIYGDNIINEDKDLDKIISEGKNLDTIFLDEDSLFGEED